MTKIGIEEDVERQGDTIRARPAERRGGGNLSLVLSSYGAREWNGHVDAVGQGGNVDECPLR